MIAGERTFLLSFGSFSCVNSHAFASKTDTWNGEGEVNLGCRTCF